MTYEAWSPLFLGMVLAMLLANGVQWFMYRERIYGLYSVYTGVWAAYFLVNYFGLPRNLSNFYKVLFSYPGYILYLELAKVFLNLHQRPRFQRWVTGVQWALAGYVAVKTYVYLFTDFWKTPLHELLLQPVRLALIAVGGYIVYAFLRSKDPVARFFVAGTASLLLNHAFATVLLIRSANLNLALPFWQHPDLYVQVGVVLDLIFFSLGISYRHRRQAVRRAVVEQELAREREQHRREHLEADLAVERLKQEKTEVQMRALQAQINPHFLFNSLNTLSSLIDESPRQAGEFVDELSSVYRYVLRANDTDLTPLRDELHFIESYFHLLKTRHGEGIRLEIAVGRNRYDDLIPPLTLQLLVENAVKHNVVLPDQPLTVRIATTPSGDLVVENTLQRKRLRVDSVGIGLSNIETKYRLLDQPAPRVEERDGWFRVTIPLLPQAKGVGV